MAAAITLYFAARLSSLVGQPDRVVREGAALGASSHPGNMPGVGVAVGDGTTDLIIPNVPSHLPGRPERP